MDRQAQGFVEVTGYAAAIEAADAMAKAAQVKIIMAHPVDGPDVCVICEGDVAACQAAVNAGKAVAQAKGALMTTNVIPRPDPASADTVTLMAEMKARKAAKVAAREARGKGAAKSPAGGNAPAAPAAVAAPAPASTPTSASPSGASVKTPAPEKKAEAKKKDAGAPKKAAPKKSGASKKAPKK